MALKSLPTFHDSRYLYTGLLAFADTGNKMPTKELERRVRQGISDYVTEQQSKYLLAERTPSYQKIPFYVISELTTYGLLERNKSNGDMFCLTDEGQHLLDLLLQRRGLLVRTRLAALYLQTFTKPLYFQKRLWELGDDPGLKIPEINYSTLDPLKRHGASQLDTVVKALGVEIADELSKQVGIRFSLDQFIAAITHELRSHDWREETKQKSFQAVRRALDNFMLPVFFPNAEISRPKFDVLRDRNDTFGLLNRRRLVKKALTWEHVYLTSWIEPPMQRQQDTSHDDFLTANVDSATLYVHEPEWLSARDRFGEALKSSWMKCRLPIGYARIVDLRNDVCFALKISNETFDGFMRRLAEGGEPKVVFSSSPERYTTKAMPLYLGQGRTYNLVRLESRKQL